MEQKKTTLGPIPWWYETIELPEWPRSEEICLTKGLGQDYLVKDIHRCTRESLLPAQTILWFSPYIIIFTHYLGDFNLWKVQMRESCLWCHPDLIPLLAHQESGPMKCRLAAQCRLRVKNQAKRSCSDQKSLLSCDSSAMACSLYCLRPSFGTACLQVATGRWQCLLDLGI